MSNTLALAEQLQRDQVMATRALAALMLNELPERVRSRVNQAVHDGTDTLAANADRDWQTELVLVPTDGSEPLWLARAR